MTVLSVHATLCASESEAASECRLFHGLRQQTHDEKNINQCKKGIYIINTARGGLIETEALLAGLSEGIVAGAGLDVLEGEEELQDEMKLLLSDQTKVSEFKKLLANHELLDLKQVIVTPHIAFNTKEAKEEIRQTTLENIKNFLADDNYHQVQ